MLFTQLYVRIHVHMLITFVSHRHFTTKEVWGNKTSLTPPHVIEVPVPSMPYDVVCICVLGNIDFVSNSTICLYNIIEQFRQWYIFCCF